MRYILAIVLFTMVSIAANAQDSTVIRLDTVVAVAMYSQCATCQPRTDVCGIVYAIDDSRKTAKVLHYITITGEQFPNAWIVWATHAVKKE